MLGWKLFSHSISMVVNNHKEAFRISLPVLAAYVLTFVTGGTINEVSVGQEGRALWLVFAISVLTVAASLWTAVAWHRFVLLEEYPKTLPAFHGNRMFSYFCLSLLAGLAVGVPVGILVPIIGIVANGAPWLSLPLIVMVFVVALWAFYRFSPLLPSTALGKPMRFAEAWNLTKPFSMPILVAGLAATVTFFVLGFANELLLGPLPIVGTATSIVLNVGVTLVGASLFTTIYGVAVEGREL